MTIPDDVIKKAVKEAISDNIDQLIVGFNHRSSKDTLQLSGRVSVRNAGQVIGSGLEPTIQTHLEFTIFTVKNVFSFCD